jgi:aminoglycoside phosphotransferase (APT) family kinase protein
VLGKLHTVRLPTAGVHDARTDSIAPLGVSYADYVEAAVQGLLDKSLEASAATSASDIDWAHSVMSEGRAAMSSPFQPVVVHLDFGFHNVLFEKQDDSWRLTGVIDWMTAESGHPESDLARPLATFRQYRIPGLDNFLAAYREAQPELPGFQQRFPVFMLWERLLIWEYWQRNKGFKESLGLRQWTEPYVRMLNSK